MKKQNVLSTIKIPYEEWINRNKLNSLFRFLKDWTYIGYTENRGITYMLYEGIIKPKRHTDK
jgi:hypothetical protein